MTSKIPQILLEHPNHEAILLNPGVDQALKDELIVEAFKSLSSNLISHNYQKYLYSLITLIAKKDIRVLCSSPIIESFSNFLYGVIEPQMQKEFSFKKCSYACILAAKVLYTMYRATEEWPTRFAIAWVYDQLRYKFWSEHPSTTEFVNDIKTAFGIHSPNSVCRFREKKNIDEVWDVTEKEIINQISKGIDQKLLGSLLIQLVQIPRVRLIGVQQLEKWIHHSGYGSTFANSFLPELIQHVYTDSEIDIQIVNILSNLKVKQNLFKFYSDCIAKLIQNHPSYSHIIMKNIVYQELQSTAIANSCNIALLQAIFSSIPDISETVLAAILQEAALNLAYHTNMMLLRVVRRVAKALAPTFNVLVFTQALFSENPDILNLSKDILEPWIFQMSQIMTTLLITIAVEKNPLPLQFSAEKQSHSPDHSEKQLTLAVMNVKMEFSFVSDLAVKWIFNILPASFLLECSPETISILLNQILFLETPQKYAQVDQQMEMRKAIELWITDLPCEESTLLTLSQTSRSYIPVIRDQLFSILHKLVYRAAHLQAIIEGKGVSKKECNCLCIRSPEFLVTIYENCTYVPTFPHDVKVPPIKVWVRQYFWEATVIALISTALNCEVLGAFTWGMPTLQFLITIIITDEIKAIESNYPGWNLLPNEKEIIQEYCFAMKELYDNLNLEHAFFQSGSLEKWVQLLTIPDEKSELRYPPPEIFKEISQLEASLNLGKYFRSCRNPDLLLHIIQEKGSQASLAWLSVVLQKEPHVLNALPVPLLCEMLTQSIDSSSRSLQVHSLRESIALHLSDRIQVNAHDTFLIFECLLSKLIDPDSEIIQNNAKNCLEFVAQSSYESSHWINFLPTLISIHGDRAINLISRTFSAYIRQGNDEELIAKIVNFLIANNIIPQQQLSLEISDLFNTKPHILRKIDWKKDDYSLLTSLQHCFLTSYKEYKSKNEDISSEYQGLLRKVFISGSTIFVHPSFLEGYLRILGVAQKFNRLSDTETQVLLEILNADTKYENGQSIVSTDLAKMFLQSSNEYILRCSLNNLKYNPDVILLEMLALSPTNQLYNSMLSFFTSLSVDEIQDILRQLSAHRLSLFFASLDVVALSFPQIATHFRNAWNSDGESQHSTLCFGYKKVNHTAQISKPLSSQSIKQLQFSNETDGNILSNFASSLQTEQLQDSNCDENHWKQVRNAILSCSSSTDSLKFEPGLYLSCDLGIDTGDWKSAIPLLDSFYRYALHNLDSISKVSLQQILHKFENLITPNEKDPICRILRLQFEEMPRNVEFEKALLQFISTQLSTDIFVSLMIDTARHCKTRRRMTIFACLSKQFPALNHPLLLQEIFCHTSTQETFDFQQVSNTFVQNGSYAYYLQIIDMFNDPTVNHRRILDFIYVVRARVYLGYKCATFENNFPEWKRSYSTNFAKCIIQAIIQEKHTSSCKTYLMSNFLKDERNNGHMSLLFEACKDVNFLTDVVSVCKDEVHSQNHYTSEAAQILLSWIYSCYPHQFCRMLFGNSFKHLPVDPLMTSNLDVTLHRLCLSLKSKQSDNFLYHYFRMLACSYPNLVLNRLNEIGTLLEFGYSTSIEKFIEKQVYLTFENVLGILHCLCPSLLHAAVKDKKVKSEFHNILDKYFMIIKRVPSSHYYRFSSLFIQFVSLLLAYKKISPKIVSKLIKGNLFSFTKLIVESKLPKLREKVEKLTFDHMGDLLSDEDETDSCDEDFPSYYLSIIQTLQYKNPQHSYNSMEINAGNTSLVAALHKLTEEISSSYHKIRRAIPSLLRLCTADDPEIRNQAYNLLVLYLNSEPQGNGEILPKYLSFFHYPDMDVRRHAISRAYDFAPFAGQYSKLLLESLFKSQSDGLHTLCYILQRMDAVMGSQ